jgi:hypothetical protein
MFSAGVQVGATLAMDWPMVSRKPRLRFAAAWWLAGGLGLSCSSIQCDVGAVSRQSGMILNDR